MNHALVSLGLVAYVSNCCLGFLFFGCSFISFLLAAAICRVTTCMENLEMSENLTAVCEMSGDFSENQGIVMEKILSGKSCLKLFIVNCIFVSLQVFGRSLLCLKC